LCGARRPFKRLASSDIHIVSPPRIGRVRRFPARVVERFLHQHREATSGIVAYAGHELFPLSAQVLAVPVERLL